MFALCDSFQSSLVILGVSRNVDCFAGKAGVYRCLRGKEARHQLSFLQLSLSLQGVAVRDGTAPKQHSDAAVKDAFNGVSEKGAHEFAYAYPQNQ